MTDVEITRLKEYLVILKKYKHLVEISEFTQKDKQEIWREDNSMNHGLCFFAMKQGFYRPYTFWGSYLLGDSPDEIRKLCYDFTVSSDRNGCTPERVKFVDNLIELIEQTVSQTVK